MQKPENQAFKTFALNMDTAGTSKTLVTTYKTHSLTHSLTHSWS
jgi:hypothetical protein